MKSSDQCPARDAFREGLRDEPGYAEQDTDVDDSALTREIFVVEVPEQAMAPLEFDDDTIVD